MLRRGPVVAIILLSLPDLFLTNLQPFVGSGQAPPPIAEVRAQRVSPIGGQPLHFEPNKGQADPRVAYLASGRGYSLLLTPDEVLVRLASNLASRREPELRGPAVRLHLVGGNPESRITALDPLPGRSHYFLGNDAKRWLRDIPHYAKVKMDSVYPGIDLVFYGTGRRLEFDFHLAPGADPSGIRLAVRGAATSRLTSTGDLELGVGGGSAILQAPVAYQEFEGQRRAVSSRFAIADNDEIGFVIGTYDLSQPLVIDPVLEYSTYLGGGSGVDKSDWGYGIAVDNAGNAYVAGQAYPADFPTTDGAFDRVGGYAGFVTKFDRNGALVYSTFLGGSGYSTEARGIAVDSGGYAYVTGQTGRTDFPTTTGAFQTSCAPGGSPYGCNDAFVVKLNPEGSGLVYSTYLGGPADAATPGAYGNETGNGIAIDAEGNAYVTGLTRSNGFPVTANAFQKTWAGGWADVFVAKLNASGSALVYATYIGGTGGSLHGDEAFAIAVDGQSHAYVTGMTTSSDFPTTAGAFRPTWSGYTNGFISKLNADGSALVYSTYLVGPGSGRVYGGRGIALDGAGNAYVTGGPAESGFPTTPGAFQPQCTPTGLCSDAFVLKLNTTGTALVWSTYLGGTAGEAGHAIALDAQGHVYVTGRTDSMNFPLFDPVQATYAGGPTDPYGPNDVFVTKMSADGSHLIYSTYFGGSGNDEGFGIAVDQSGTAYVTGTTSSTNFPTLDAAQPSNHGTLDAFAFKLVAPPPPTLALDKTSFRFGAVTTGSAFVSQTAAQIVRLTQAGTGLVTWTAASNQPWLQVSPPSGTGSATLSISVAAVPGLPLSGSVAGAITLRVMGASNVPGPVAVSLTVIEDGTSAPPIGFLDTPIDHQVGVTGAIPFTGWALDDVEVTRVMICRAAVSPELAPVDPNCGGAAQIFVGFAVFIDGARPDVAAYFPTYPANTRAGWGFMVLTNMLPNQGNGTYLFFMHAQDRDGHTTQLGTRTMTCANAGGTKPFGAIDTPTQGGLASGSSFVNFGWALTPQPKLIPIDGSTISVLVDGNVLGTVDYNHERPDIEAAFPGYQNTAGPNGGIGFRILDTTTLTNGLHTISWTVVDDQGAIEGIGSRFFTVSNGVSVLTAAEGAMSSVARPPDAAQVRAIDLTPPDGATLVGRRGWDLSVPYQAFAPDVSGRVVIRSEEVNRVELGLGDAAGARYQGYLRTGGGLAPLPIGSRLDATTGVFTWAPGVGFVGAYDLVFVRWVGAQAVTRQEVRIVLAPKGSGRVGPQVVIDAPRAQQDVAQPFVLGGWAADLRATTGTGIAAVHAWAYPLAGGAPVFLGATAYGGARPDVAAVHGDRFRESGFGLVVQGLSPGHYDVAVFAWSTETADFMPARVVRVTVR